MAQWFVPPVVVPLGLAALIVVVVLIRHLSGV